MPILPPKDQTGMVSSGIRLPKTLVRDLKAIAKESGYKRSEVIIRFLEWAVSEYQEEKNQEEKKLKTGA